MVIFQKNATAELKSEDTDLALTDLIFNERLLNSELNDVLQVISD
jgi:hypothetical protein